MKYLRKKGTDAWWCQNCSSPADDLRSQREYHRKSYLSIVLCFALVMASVSPGHAASQLKENGAKTPMKYEGGSLPLDQHASLDTYIGNEEVVVVQGKQRFVIPALSRNL